MFFSNFRVESEGQCQREPKLVKFHCHLAENILGTNFRIGSVDIYETMFPGLAGENLVHQSKNCWRLFSQLASLSYRFGMIEPDHVTGCEHQPIEFRRVSRMQKNSILKILRTTERKGVSNHPATFAFSTKYQMIQRVLVHLRRGCRSTVFLCEYCSISTHIDVDRPPGIG